MDKPHLLKRTLIVSAIFIAVILLYWAKCQLGVNIFKDFAWESRFPILNALQRQERTVILPPGPADILIATFDDLFPGRLWKDIWMSVPDAVELRYVREGADGSRCLRVDNRWLKDWALPQFDLVRVTPGDELAIDAVVRTTGTAKVALGMIAYGDHRQVISYGLGSEAVTSPAGWRHEARHVVVPKDVHYVRFDIYGSGAGTVWIDDIRFRKEK